MTDEEEIVSRLHAFGEGLQGRRLTAIADQFAPDDAIAVVASESGPYRGQADVRAFFARVDNASVVYGWAWHSVDVHVDGDTAWLLAHGEELIDEPGRAQRRLPYRLTGVLDRIGGEWRWRHVHGSEPAEER